LGAFHSPKICLASSSETDPAMITSSPCRQFTGVDTRCLAVSCSESITRGTSSKSHDQAQIARDAYRDFGKGSGHIRIGRRRQGSAAAPFYGQRRYRAFSLSPRQSPAARSENPMH
jgi:hypothetical protein